MKNYKIAKWLGFAAAVLAIASIFLPSGNERIPLFLNNIIFLEDDVWGLAPILITFLVAISATVLSILPLILNDENGLNRQGKRHKTLIVSVALSEACAISYLFFDMALSYWYRQDEIGLTFVGLIIITLITVPAIILYAKSKDEVATNSATSEGEQSKTEQSATDAPQTEDGKQAKKEKSKVKKTNVYTGIPGNPKYKPLDWFKSAEGLEVYKAYITPQNYIFEESNIKRYKEKFGDRLSLIDAYEVMANAHSDVKLPHTYFNALIENIKVEPLQYKPICNILVQVLEDQAKPYIINEDGEPEPRKMAFTPEQIVDVDKNPVLYFVKNFDAFKIESDAMGTDDDKYHTYAKALMFIGTVSDEIVMEENEWLLDKDTYLNDFGMVRKEKAFIKKCMECTQNAKLLAVLAMMHGNVDAFKEQREQAAAAQKQAQEQAHQAYEQRRQAEEQRRFAEQQAYEQRKQAEEQKDLMKKQMDEQKKAAQMQACATATCPNCRRQCGMSSYVPAGYSGCACFIK